MGCVFAYAQPLANWLNWESVRSASGLGEVRGSVSKVQKTTMKEIPFPRKAQAGPRTARTTPPTLGPIALAALNWVEFKVIAFIKKSRGTKSATYACQAGNA